MSDENQIKAGVEFYRENSEINSGGMRVIPKGPFIERLKVVHDVTDDDVKKVQNAINFETNVAAHVTLEDLVDKIEATPVEDRDEEFRINVKAATRLPTHGGSTEITVNGEGTVNVPGRPDADGNNPGPTSRQDWGRTRTTIKAKGRIDKNFPDMARDRLRDMLKV